VIVGVAAASVPVAWSAADLGGPPWAPFLLALVVLVATCVLTTPNDQQWDPRAELLHGFAASVLVVAALAAPLAMLWVKSWVAFAQAAFCLGLFALAMAVASTDWLRRSLRVAALSFVLLSVVLVVDIGRTEAPTATAMREAERTAEVIGRLAQVPTDDELVQARVSALTELDEALAAVDPAIGRNPPRTTELVGRANQVRGALQADAPADDVDAAAQGFSALFPSDETDPELVALRDAVSTAVAAHKAVERPSPEPARASIASVCAAAREEAEVPDGLTCGTKPDLPLAVAVAMMRVDLASFRNVVLGRATDADALTAAKEELIAVRAAGGTSSVSLLDALTAGGDEIVASITGGGVDPPIVLEALGWVTLLVVALALWRIVERRSAAQMLGPVTQELTTAAVKEEAKPATATAEPEPAPTEPKKEGAVTSNDEAAQKAAFRSALLVNLSEPAAAPGATTPTQVTDLAELTSVSGLSKLVTAVASVVTKPGGFTVKGDVLGPTEKGGEWSVVTKVTDAWTGDQVAVRTLAGPSPVEACRAAGLWAAAFVINRSSRVPAWAQWSPSSATALAGDPSSKEVATEALENAIAEAPTSGLLLAELGYAYDIAERRLDALSLYARAVALYPRYLVTRYRFAVSLGMMTKDVWAMAPLWERKRITKELERTFFRLQVDSTEVAGLQSVTDDDVAERFRLLAEEVHADLENNVHWWNWTVQVFRRSERSVVWPRLRSMWGAFGRGTRWLWLVRSARLAVSFAPGTSLGSDAQATYETITATARRVGSFWQLSYNLACFHARTGDVDTALDWLETALERPGGGQVAGEWLEKDPDLASLRATDRFKWVVAQVKQT
jgi:hypothetical protein